MIGKLDAGLFEVVTASLDYARAAVDAARLSLDDDDRSQRREAATALLSSRAELARSLQDLIDRLAES